MKRKKKQVHNSLSLCFALFVFWIYTSCIYTGVSARSLMKKKRGMSDKYHKQERENRIKQQTFGEYINPNHSKIEKDHQEYYDLSSMVDQVA